MAEGFGVDPDRYDRTRPHYPDELVNRIISTSPGRAVLDVGCGTGIVARQFRDAGCTVLGVEPDARMAAFARSTGIDVEVSTLEEWSSDGRLFDVVVAGMTWHWVDPVAGSAKVASVLRPGGRVAVFWHAFEMPAAVAAALADAFAQVLPDAPVKMGTTQGVALYQPGLDKALDGFRSEGGFADFDQWRFDWDRVYTKDEWLDQIPTQGTMTSLPAEKLDQILSTVGAAIDELGGSFTMKYSTVAATAVRSG
ncbi:methyltransferase family protein [Labedaea rhizosphaerae]|uniref:Methyltransferase family protein n=2 Tax=Labedaea rhizosphaerae TaxID=598644 RepID=A0A4V3D021_LABRH|nr:methyltransferase family protein [Labedaea rhizosphaerae]